MKIFPLFLISMLSALLNTAHAGAILQANQVTADSQFAVAVADNLINQIGLSSGFTSQVTDFDSFLTDTVHYNTCGSTCGVWGSDTPVSLPLNLDFDLGGSFSISSLGLWNYGTADVGVNDFTLYASNDASFSSATNLGTFSALSLDTTLNQGQVFTFDSIETSYIRMTITSTGGSTHQVALGEVVFEIADPEAEIPEPTSLFLIGLGLLGLSFARKKNQA